MLNTHTSGTLLLIPGQAAFDIKDIEPWLSPGLVFQIGFPRPGESITAYLYLALHFPSHTRVCLPLAINNAPIQCDYLSKSQHFQQG
ncbi:hypothetical protein EYC84_001146 [Monilinia fructicola]|uniref:Uncharacterized protein n=1 Tax=Monilinia fructicola TaxID=38448 RepID=A0A5M9JMC1_MONFR|nr:hypothetical protein EYC84_001146 [Monilinia fructicola]